jgi:hypothetical protein
MRLDEGFDGNFFYGPSLSLYREPFVNERYLFGDGRYHNCTPYLDMEKEFFSENAAIVREVFFDKQRILCLFEVLYVFLFRPFWCDLFFELFVIVSWR